jgi:hypothetical protein
MRNGTIIDDLVERLFLKLLGDPLFLEQSISGRYLRAGDLSLLQWMRFDFIYLPASTGCTVAARHPGLRGKISTQ